MKALIVCVSASDGNTRKIADAMAGVLDVRVVGPDEVDEDTLMESDLVGVGSGIYAMGFHPKLQWFVRRLPKVTEKPAFIYWTSGGPEPPVWRYSRGMARRLNAKGFDVLDTFSCRGQGISLPLPLIGRLLEDRPNDTDLADARSFVTEMQERLQQAA